MREDPSLFERGGTASAGQTGEEYRQTLRKALAQNPDRLRTMPWSIGSGMARGVTAGAFFCASVGEGTELQRTYLRFVPTDAVWRWTGDIDSIQREIGTCLRLIECDDTTPRVVPAALEEAAFDLWEVAREDVWQSWMRETDPANLQPKVRPLNQRVENSSAPIALQTTPRTISTGRSISLKHHGRGGKKSYYVIGSPTQAPRAQRRRDAS